MGITRTVGMAHYSAAGCVVKPRYYDRASLARSANAMINAGRLRNVSLGLPRTPLNTYNIFKKEVHMTDPATPARLRVRAESLFIYPIKSCAGVRVPSIQFDALGAIEGDRQWAVADT